MNVILVGLRAACRAWRPQRLAAGLVGGMLVLGPAGAQAQSVWKCEQGGQVRFSDKPCPGQGQPVQERSLQSNVVESLKPEVVRAALGGPAASAPALGAPAGNVCPSEIGRAHV